MLDCNYPKQQQELDLQSLQALYTSTDQQVPHDCAAINTARPCNVGEIRLLTFCTQSSFTLEKACLRDDPHYVAISYRWGNAENFCDVLINDRNVKLRGHVYAMLSQLHCQHQVTRVWIDMICINQNDRNEKSVQVPLMGEIYSKAAQVYAWLGETDDETSLVFDVLTEFRDVKTEVSLPIQFDAAEQLSCHRQRFREIYYNKAGTLHEKRNSDDDMLHEEFNWLRPLYIRCYWRRVWIVQELVLAKTVVVCCGDKYINFDDIYGLSLDWGSFEQGFDTGTYQMLKPESRGWNTIRAIRGHRRRREPEVEMPYQVGLETAWQASTGIAGQGDGAMLDEVIGVYAQHHGCREPKDKVYGFCELVPQWKEKLVVDYKRSDLEVFLDVANLGLFETQKHGGWHVASQLWSAMGLGDREKLNDCISAFLPEICHQRI